jgi:hypothetical protein
MTESIRMIIKSIPGYITDSQIFEILNKNLENQIFDVNVTYSSHQTDARAKSKICLFTVKSLESRLKVYEFFYDFEAIDSKGFKQKFNVVDCLYQKVSSKNKCQDPIENTIKNSIFVITK